MTLTFVKEHVLLTGGLGYIGSHVAVSLLRAGHDVSIVDNLANSRIGMLKTIGQLGGAHAIFHLADIRDRPTLDRIFAARNVTAVVHCAGLKAVAESEENPLTYYDTNVAGSITLLQAMQQAGVRNIVFSSSATVYGEPDYVPIDEAHSRTPCNPYGRTKLTVERILEDLCERRLNRFDRIFRHHAAVHRGRRKLRQRIHRVATFELRCHACSTQRRIPHWRIGRRALHGLA